MKHKKDPIAESVEINALVEFFKPIVSDVVESYRKSGKEVKPYTLLFTIFDLEAMTFGSFKKLSLESQEEFVQKFKQMIKELQK